MTTLITLKDLNTTVNHEPRILDVKIGEALGMAQPLNIRATIEANRMELEGFGSIHAARELIEAGKGAKREVTRYYLNEPQALLLCMFSRTEKAAAVRKALIEVYQAYRSGALAPAEKTVAVRPHERRRPMRRDMLVLGLVFDILAGFEERLRIIHDVPLEGLPHLPHDIRAAILRGLALYEKGEAPSEIAEYAKIFGGIVAQGMIYPSFRHDVPFLTQPSAIARRDKEEE